MNTILGLKFRENGQIYYFDADSHQIAPGDYVLVKTEQGPAVGQVATQGNAPPPGLDLAEIKPIERPASPDDLAQHQENRRTAQEAIRHCRQCIHERELDMKLVDVEVLQDRSKMVFYFTAPGRIDFRELVKDLVKTWRTRIELRQIGVRHETQMIGAIGNCGQMCCCARFIRKFQPVTIKMAKEQNLFLNPSKISGMCGRLLCCLAYEQNAYEEFQRRCPKIGKKYQTTLGPVKILRTNLFKETVSVWAESGEEKELTLEEWTAVAGETWTPYIPPPQQPQQRPRGDRPRDAQEQPQPRGKGQPGQSRSGQASPQRCQHGGKPCRSADQTPVGDDGQAVAQGQPEDFPEARADGASGRGAATPGQGAFDQPGLDQPGDDQPRGDQPGLGQPEGLQPGVGQPGAGQAASDGQRSRRRRKRKPKSKRPEGQRPPTTESGE